MDILSTSLTALITSFSSSITDSYVDNANTQVTPVVIEYQGGDIYFENFLWKIRDNTLCQNKRQRITEFSECTIEAKTAFEEVCRVHSPKNYTNHRAKSMVRMYCQAASTFKPTIASIKTSSGNNSFDAKTRELKQKCSMLTLQSQSTDDPSIDSERINICSKYKQLLKK